MELFAINRSWSELKLADEPADEVFYFPINRSWSELKPNKL